ncbi:MAG: SRPBCC family protein [Bacteroidetes bacterium]|nr:SRPBCC family protein [Bacteroidota bacterium]
MRIESDKSEINKPASEVFSFLSDFNNFQKLMPEQVTNWKSTADECSFTISGMATIGMKIIEKIPNTLVKISSAPALVGTSSKMPLDFTLGIYLTETAPVQCTGQFIFESDINPMMKMMLEKPLTKFFNFLAWKMKEIS